MDAGLITEHRPCAWPTVYGYLRLARRSLARHAALATALAEYCRQHELELASIFTEYDTTDEARPASFVGLLDVLSMASTYGVVVPSEHHIGHRDVAQARLRQIAGTGSRLMVVRGAKASSAGRSASDRWMWATHQTRRPSLEWT